MTEAPDPDPGMRAAMHYDYFVASSDTAAAAVLDRPGALQGEPGLPGLLSPAHAGVQFSQELGRFAALLGEDVDLEDEEHIVAAVGDDSDIVVRVPPALTRAIAAAEPARLHALVPAWAEFEDFADPDEARLRAFADDLQRLSRMAIEADGQVYSHGWA